MRKELHMTTQFSGATIRTQNRSHAANIIPFEKYHSVFDPEALQAMSLAFQAICAALGTAEANEREREVIAANIIELAQRGERNAERLRDHVLREAASGSTARAETVRRWRESRQV
jgi:hypothetical protein